MDSFINLAQKGVSAYAQSHSSSNRSDDRDDDSNDVGNRYTNTGGQEYNSPHHRSGGEAQSFYDDDEVVKKASSHSSEDSSMFSSALDHIKSNPNSHHEPIDEDEATEAHRKIYKQGSSDGVSANSMGSAAALQILQQFTSGGKSGSKSDMISLAMAEASKLFDSSGGSASGNKQDAVNSAGMTIMKLMVQSKLGGGGAGGVGGLMSMASKFM